MEKKIKIKAKRNRRSTLKKSVIGPGEFASGISDLGRNKKYLRGYGS